MDPSTNIHFLCRLCGSKTKELQRINMFDSAGVLLEVKSKIMFCLGINIDEKDNLPQVLCTECVDNVNNYTRFKQNAEKTTDLLQGLFSQQDETVENSQNSCNVEDDSIFDTANYISDPEELIIKPDDSDSLLDQTINNPLVIDNKKRSTKRKRSKTSRKRSRKYAKVPMQPESNIVNDIVEAEKPIKTSAKRQKNSRKIDKSITYNCDICEKTFQYKQLIYRHMVRHSKKKSNPTCHHCLKIFWSKSELYRHVKSNHKPVEKCKNNVSKVDNKIKEKQIKDETFECDLCKKVYKRKHNIVYHMVKHFTPKPIKKKVTYTCSYCGQNFTAKGSLVRHIESKHEFKFKEPKIIICHHCGKKCRDITRFKYHLNTKHPSSLPFECDKCDKKFAVRELLQSHIKNMHTENRVKYLCDFCGKALQTKNGLMKHKMKHEKTPEELQALKIYKCLACDFAYDHPCHLRYHMRVHTGETPFECKFCQKKYVRKSGLKVHLLTHTGERKFVCDVCGKAFAIDKNLKIHKLIHTGERIFQCNDCDKTYTQNSTLNIHLKKTGHTRKRV